MTSTSKNNAMSKKSKEELQAEENAEILAMRARLKAHRMRAARELASRLQVQADGTRLFVRFDKQERLQHQILIGSFTALGFTGLMQSFSRFEFIAWIINSLLGGIETLRVIHHLAAMVFAAQAIYHAVQIFNLWFIRRELGSMWPRWSDVKDLAAMLKFDLNLGRERPQFDRFSYEEKVEYWALLWGTVIMGITGLFQWFPLIITSILPGVSIPIARTIHAWEALLAVLAILTWHIYHTVIKERNQSIFTGVMSEEEMQELHPLEYRRILAAVEFIRRVEAHEFETASPKTEQVASSHEMVEFVSAD
ncbi:MAG: cytochrome b/b6 domain-containing protein [Chloroflexi bacterium]|nr:cytochrome b/b6 domain-containing protein [Chloroflexota bacterium]